MSVVDQSIGVKNETTWGTPATPVDRFYEINSEGIEDSYGRTEGDPLRVGTWFKRADRSTPYYEGASGPIEMDVMTKGFGWWLKHMLGAVVTSGPTETVVYTHTATVADLLGTSFTYQVGRPLHPTGTVQPLTYEGGKLTEWTLSNSVLDNLVLEVNADFQQVATATSLATVSYPTGMENLTWIGGSLTIGGVATPITEFSLNVNNGLNTDRRYIQGSADKKEQTGGRREGSFSITADFDSLTLRNKAAATTAAGTQAALVALWEGPTLLGSTIKPSLQVTVPVGQFDGWSAPNEGPEGIMQELSGSVKFDGTNSSLTAVYKSADSIA